MPLAVWAMLRTSITLDTYSRVIPAMQEDEAMRIAGLVSAASSHCPPAAKGRGKPSYSPLVERRGRELRSLR